MGRNLSVSVVAACIAATLLMTRAAIAQGSVIGGPAGPGGWAPGWDNRHPEWAAAPIIGGGLPTPFGYQYIYRYPTYYADGAPAYYGYGRCYPYGPSPVTPCYPAPREIGLPVPSFAGPQ
jgi:hypothetical protein